MSQGFDQDTGDWIATPGGAPRRIRTTATTCLCAVYLLSWTRPSQQEDGFDIQREPSDGAVQRLVGREPAPPLRPPQRGRAAAAPSTAPPGAAPPSRAQAEGATNSHRFLPFTQVPWKEEVSSIP